MIDPIDYACSRDDGVTWYEHPDSLDPLGLDPLIAPVVLEINTSGWVWTAESCQGHPDAKGPAWGGNTSPMLRLVTKVHHEGRMFSLLAHASRIVAGIVERKEGLARTVPLHVYPSTLKSSETWVEHLVYAHATTAYGRNLGIQCFAEFAKLARPHAR